MKPFFTHVALQVKDLDTSIAFYRSFCGMTITQERVDRVAGGDTRVVWMAEPGRENELIFVLMAVSVRSAIEEKTGVISVPTGTHHKMAGVWES